MILQNEKIKSFWPVDTDPLLIANKTIADLLSRKDFMLYDTGSVRALHYAEACAAFGAARYGRDKLPPNTANHVDANVCGIIPLELFLYLGDPDLLSQGLAFADGQWMNPQADGLFFHGPEAPHY